MGNNPLQLFVLPLHDDRMFIIKSSFLKLSIMADVKKILVIVEKSADGYFWCYTEQPVGGVGLNACGATVEEAKADLLECYDEVKEDNKENGIDTPDVEFEYKYDVQSFFNYFSFLNVNEIARRSGINESLLRQYVSGKKKAGEKTYKRLADCIRSITLEMQAATF